jgi:hypothetical protein
LAISQAAQVADTTCPGSQSRGLPLSSGGLASLRTPLSVMEPESAAEPALPAAPPLFDAVLRPPLDDVAAVVPPLEGVLVVAPPRGGVVDVAPPFDGLPPVPAPPPAPPSFIDASGEGERECALSLEHAARATAQRIASGRDGDCADASGCVGMRAACAGPTTNVVALLFATNRAFDVGCGLVAPMARNARAGTCASERDVE